MITEEKELRALELFPTVFAGEHRYQIFMPFRCQAVVWVKVGNETYYDDFCGILRSASPMHRVEVPMEVLDAAGAYTVVYRKMIQRKPYFSTSEEEVSLTFAFRPVANITDRHNLRIYHISDAHNEEEAVIAAGKRYGRMDLLILNGDLPNHSGSVENFISIYRIASALTKGGIPVVFSRGNHDTRGICAENFGEYTPLYRGKTYFTFRLGSLWGMVLDCGEDKRDECEEYGHTVCFHAFRMAETEWIRGVIARAEQEYLAEGVTNRVVISHIPFGTFYPAPFDIEQELYGEWCRMLREEIRPQLMIHGHKHTAEIWDVGGPNDDLGFPAPSLVGALVTKNADGGRYFAGMGVELSPNSATVTVNDRDGELSRTVLSLP